MSNYVFWLGSTPVPSAGEYASCYIPVRLAGAAADGSQDQFMQIPLSAILGASNVLTALASALSGEPDADGGAIPGGAAIYTDGDFIKLNRGS